MGIFIGGNFHRWQFSGGQFFGGAIFTEPYKATVTLFLQNFAVTAQAKNVQKKTVLLVLVIIVAYQNAKVLFILNVMEKESKLALA